MFMILLPSLLLSVKLIELLAAFLFSLGFIYFVCFQCARFNFKGMDIKATKYYNWQGFNSYQFIIGFIVVFLPGCIAFAINQFFGENIVLLVMSITGIGFIVTNKCWLMSIAKSFEKTRYRRLECFREK
jgi:hypothetical protein